MIASFKIMKYYFLFCFLVFSIECLRAEHLDENGIRRVGPPGSSTSGYKDPSGVHRMEEPAPGTKVLNSKGKTVTVPEKQLIGTRAPERYNQNCRRVINDQIYDFSTIAEWANEYAYVLSMAAKPRTPAGLLLTGPLTKGATKAQPQMGDWEARWTQNQAQAETYGNYFLCGRVKKVLADGILVESIQPTTNAKSTRILKNYPLKDQVADDDPLEVLALPTSSYTSKALGQKTIRAYDYGRIANENDKDLNVISLP